MDNIGRVLDIDLTDEAEVNVIRFGWLSGTGLIGDVFDTVRDIAKHAVEASRYEGIAEGVIADRKLGDAWMRLYRLLKRVEEIGND